MLLIFPPVAKPSEPPAGVALLAGALKKHGIQCTVFDANIEGLRWLINTNIKPEDSWTKRALANREKTLKDLKKLDTYTNLDRYKQKVYDLNRILSVCCPQERFRITLADYSDRKLSPLKTGDLLKSAQDFRENPFFSFFEERVSAVIESSSYEYVGISLCYLNQALVAFALAGWIKHRFPEKKIIMGGGLISSWMSRPNFMNTLNSGISLEHPFKRVVDILIKGEGEHSLLKLFDVNEADKFRFIPDYDDIEWDLYLSPGKILPYRSSIGCYWSKCRFCPEKAETRPYRSVKSNQILDEIEILNHKYQPEYVHFIDNAVTPAVLRSLCKRAFGFKWYGFVRFTKELADQEFCNDLKHSGCAMLNLGLESGDQGVLDNMQKGTCLKTASDALKHLNQSGILTYVYLLFGTSFENEASAIQTLEYVKAHQQYIDFLNIAVFNLPRYSEDAKGLATHDFYEGDLSLYYNFDHPDGWSRQKVKQFLDKKFKKEKSIARIVQKNPPIFTSNHAMFFQRK